MMKSLAELISEIIAAEKRRGELQDAVALMVLTQDCPLTGWVIFEDYDPCFSELHTQDMMN